MLLRGVAQLVLVLVAVAACTLSTRALVWQLPTSGDLLEQVTAIGQFTDEGLPESSGLAPSSQDPSIYWTLNDSGHDPILWAIDTTGKTQARVRMRGAENRDWEALASGPCPRGRCLYVGDVGDNLAQRAAVVLWRVPEPVAGVAVSDTAEQLLLRYPDGPRDVEAMYVAPDGAVWLIAKRPPHRVLPLRERARLYRVPAAAWRRMEDAPRLQDTVVAAAMGTLPIIPGHLSVKEWITDASLSPPDARGVRQLAVLTYGAVHLFAVDSFTGAPGAPLRRCALPILEHDSEAIGWLPERRLLITNEGAHSVLYSGRCSPETRMP